MNNPTTFNVKVNLIVASTQFNHPKELANFIRDTLTSFDGTEYHTNWCVVEKVEVMSGPLKGEEQQS